MIVGEIPEQTAADVEQKLKTKSGGEFDVPGGVPRGAGSRGPQFTPPQRFATFALRLQPFASEFRRRSPVCSENDAFPERKGDLNFANEHRSAAKTMPASRDAGTRAEIVVSLQTGARSPVACSSACLFTGCLFTGCLFDRNQDLLWEDRSLDRNREWIREDWIGIWNAIGKIGVGIENGIGIE